MPTKKSKSIVEYRNYYLPADFPVLLLTGDVWRLSDVPAEALHFHNCLEIGICQSDSGMLAFYDGQNLPFREGDITCIPRNIPHTTYSSPHTMSKWSYLFFDPGQLFLGLSGNLSFDLTQQEVGNYILHGIDHPRISFLTNVIIEELSQNEPDYPLAKNYLFALYYELNRVLRSTAVSHTSLSVSASASPDAPPASRNPALLEANSLAIAPALNYIEDNYMNKFPIEILAEQCHLSQTHFRRVFQSIMRVSPLSYLNNIRIMNACNLLRNTNQTILSIAETTGFSTLSNFNRHFSQLMKMSPRDYRKKMYREQLAGDQPSIIEYTGWMEPYVEPHSTRTPNR